MKSAFIYKATGTADFLVSCRNYKIHTGGIPLHTVNLRKLKKSDKWSVHVYN